MATWGPVLAAVLTAVIGLLSNVSGIWLGRRLERSGEREPQPYRLTVIDRWGWVSIVAAIATAVAVGFFVGTAVVWIAGGAAVAGYAGLVAWWGWRKMPLLTREARTWLRSWESENDGQGGLSYRDELTGLADRTYTVQDLSRVEDLPAGRLGDESRGEVLSPDDLLGSGVHVLVTGEAGVGKSTNLRHFGSDPAQRFWAEATRGTASTSGPMPGWFPVLLSARDLAGRATIEAALGPAPKKMLTRAPARGARWLVLVDAVDEVLNANQRQRVWALLLKTVRDEGPFRFVITSRSVDSTRWLDLQHRGVAHYELHPFTDEQLLAFAIRHQSGRSSPAESERPGVKQRAAEFVDHLHRKGLVEVVRLPLLAKLAADMYFDNRRRDLPMRRVDLYEHSIRQWLGKFDKVLERDVLKGVPDGERDDVHMLLNNLDKRYPAAAKEGRAVVLRAFLTHLASVLTHDAYGRANLDLDKTAADLMNVDTHFILPATRLAVGRVLEATGLIRDPYHDARFWHQTFAEYLAAPILVAQESDYPEAWDHDAYEPEFWARRLEDSATRPGMVFAFHHLSKDRQLRLIRALTGTWAHLRCSAILAAEGLCDDDALEFLCDQLWKSQPVGSYQKSFSHVRWWEIVSSLADQPMMKRRLRILCDHDSVIGFPARVNALAVLARNGDQECRARLDGLVREVEARPCLNWSDVVDRAQLADAVAMVDMECGVEMLVRLAGDSSFSAHRGEHLLQVVARIDVERWSAKALEVAGDLFVDLSVRINVAETLAGVGDGRGLTVLAELSRDETISRENRKIAAVRLAEAFKKSPADVRQVLARDDIDRVNAALGTIAMASHPGLNVAGPSR